MDVPFAVLVAFVAGCVGGWFARAEWTRRADLAVAEALAKRNGNQADSRQPDAQAWTSASMHAHAINDDETARRLAQKVLRGASLSPFELSRADEPRTHVFGAVPRLEDPRTAFDGSPAVERETSDAVDPVSPDAVEREYSSALQESAQNVLERVCREFLATCDTQDMSYDGAEDWFRQRSIECKSLDIDPERWHLLLVNASNNTMTGFVVPAMRRSMGSVSLSNYYELNRYNGLDPLQPRDIATFCKMFVSTRKVTQKGSIDVR